MSRSNVSCPSHPDASLIEDYRAGDLVCPECGLVVGDRVVDVGSEWRTFTSDTPNADPSRVGAAENHLLGGFDLTTIVGPSTSAASLDSEGNVKYATRRHLSSSDRTLVSSYKEISNMSEKINLPKTIVDRAKDLFKQVHDGGKLKGRSNDAIASACLYIACRQEAVPRTFKEIRALSSVSKNEITRCYQLILKVLNISVDLITTDDFMSRFCAHLGLSNSVQRAASHISHQAGESDIVSGRSPVSVVAASIYLASQASAEKRSPKEIADISGVSRGTISDVYKLMLPNAAQLFPDDFKFITPIEQLPRT